MWWDCVPAGKEEASWKGWKNGRFGPRLVCKPLLSFDSPLTSMRPSPTPLIHLYFCSFYSLVVSWSLSEISWGLCWAALICDGIIISLPWTESFILQGRDDHGVSPNVRICLESLSLVQVSDADQFKLCRSLINTSGRRFLGSRILE